MVNLWCPYFKLYLVRIINLWCFVSTVSNVVLPGGWCKFSFYLVGHSSRCNCYLCWDHHILVTACVGWFCDEVSLSPTVPGGVCCVLVMASFEVVVPGGGFLDVQWSGLPVWWWTWCFLYPAVMMNHLVTCCFDFTRWVMVGNFYAWLALGATEFLQIYFYCTTGLSLWFWKVWFGLLKLSGSEGILKFTLVCVT